jgi:hypothetical protein
MSRLYTAKAALFSLLSVGLLFAGTAPAVAQRADDRVLAPQFRLDLSAVALGSPLGCHRVTFRVTLSPSPLAEPGDPLLRSIPVEVHVIDTVNGVPRLMGTQLLFLHAGGGAETRTVEFDAPVDAFVGRGVLDNELTIVVDPSNRVAERDEKNNSVAIRLRCVPEPDLVVESVEPAGRPDLGPRGQVIVPLRVVIRNRGHAPAARFQVGVAAPPCDVDNVAFGGCTVFPFIVSSPVGDPIPMTAAPLAAGGAVTLQGTVVLPPDQQSLTGTTFYVKADPFDRIEESNNQVARTVVLPAGDPNRRPGF